jgi:hyperosmotically inducible protein
VLDSAPQFFASQNHDSGGKMKRVSTALGLFVLLSIAVVAAQDSASAPRKQQSKPAVDCSSTNDANITEDVKTRLAKAASLKDMAITVSTNSGVVTLTGTVKTGRNKGTASLVARRAPCVKRVDNQLTVESASTASTGSSKKSMKSGS